MSEYLYQIAIALIIAPLIGAVIVGYFSTMPDKIANFITCTGAFIAFLSAYIIFHQIHAVNQVINIELAPWFTYSSFSFSWSIYIDKLTAFMLLAITTVSFLVHVYSISYMEHDAHRPRFMAYLSLFTFSMLMLVCSNNFVQMFFGWEGVGLCSYLLIGFWYKKPSASRAAIKAFIVNRVGDVGLALGVFLIFSKIGSVNYAEVFAVMPTLVGDKTMIFGTQFDTITLICCLLFIGCMGKSAQLGLHTWLPDAMEGPTPVSALIHAATMVTAGVFLVARCSPIFEYSEFALNLITVIGALTCVFAATIALVQNDIKRIIAYSTCSQLGYMFFACGVSAYSAGIFHLVTHAAFKALLFLSAGSVIHALHDQQDIRKMGGLWRKIPFTYAMFWIGSLAIAGIYPFAGYFSKDAIIELAYLSNAKYANFAFTIGVLVAYLTAFYSWRLMIKVFHGPRNMSKKEYDSAHESPIAILIPLALLAAASVTSGYYFEHFYNIVNFASDAWSGALFVMENHDIMLAAEHAPHIIEYAATIAAVCGILSAYLLYSLAPALLRFITGMFAILIKIFQEKYYFDYIYDNKIVNFVRGLSVLFWRGIDVKLIDGVPNITYKFIRNTGARFSAIQTGYFYHYALVMIASLVLFLLWFVVMK